MDGTAHDPCIKNENALLSRSQRAAYILNCDDASRNLWNGGQRKVVTGCLKFGPNSATGSLATAITRPMMDTEEPASRFHQLYWYPRVDGQNGVLPDQYEILAAKRNDRISILMGVSLDNWAWEMLPIDFQNEDLLLTLYSGGLAFNDSELANKTCDNLLTDQIMLGGEMGPDKLDDLRRKCKERYSALLFNGGGNGQHKTTDDYLFFHRAVRAASSFHYIAPMCKTAATLRKQGKWNTYMYSLEYRRNTTYGRAVGTYRNLDMQLTANYANSTFLFDDRDNLIREILLDMLTNFVKNRQPTSQTSKFFTHWYTMGGGNCYMQINGEENPKMKFAYFADDCNFWINNGV
uniref:Carboxylesterase type B domain-containing protein n=1 Tax=Romanomermis culicivorax TaxID=13658 RepID=A0A915L9J4_ROMCU